MAVLRVSDDLSRRQQPLREESRERRDSVRAAVVLVVPFEAQSNMSEDPQQVQ